MRVAKLSVLFSLFVLPLVASAESIPTYANIGTVAPAETYTATQSGSVTGYFVQGGALSGGHELYTDFVQLYDTTSGAKSGYVFNSQTSHTGDSLTLGNVNAGDQLVFEIYVSNLNQLFASNPALSADGLNHVYSASYAGGVSNGAALPAGLYLGLEDTSIPTNNNPGNLDYNDLSLVVSDVTATGSSPVPEPGSLLLLCSGAITSALALRRRLRM